MSAVPSPAPAGLAAISPLRLLVLIMLVAAAYFLSGRLGLLLAIPPGYATAVWPASGIALAALLHAGRGVWPGVWLGSLLINLPSAQADPAAGLVAQWLVPALVASGASLQALIGAHLVRHWVRGRPMLDLGVDAIRLLLVGGPLSCVISASVGVSTLALTGAVAADGFLINWVTWWVGDSMGVLLFTPLALIWAQRPWHDGLRERVFVSLPLVGAFALVVAVFVMVSARENQRLRAQFDRSCDAYLVDLRDRVEDKIAALYAVRGLFSGAGVEAAEPGRERFDGVASALIERLPGLRALAWSPRVAESALAAFEQAGRADYGPAFAYRAEAGQTAAQAILGRVPTRLIAPLLGNAPALGVDLASNARVAGALIGSAESGKALASAVLSLSQDPSNTPALLIVLPVYESPDGIAGDGDARAVRGFVSAALVADRTLAPGLAALEAEGVHLLLSYLGEGAPQPLHVSAGAAAAGGYERVENLTIAGRSWRVEMRQSDAHLLARRSWETWTVLAAGLLFTSLLGMFLLLVFGRGRRAEQLVSARTAELRQVNQDLSDELQRGQGQRQDAVQRADELAASNRELEQFGNIVAHDLAAPLRSVGNFAQLLEQRVSGLLDERNREFLGLIREGVGEMQGLIDGLLRISRVTRERMHPGAVDSGLLVARVQEKLAGEIQAALGEVRVDELPRVEADESLLLQVFEQLVSNALRFRRPQIAPRVRVSAQATDTAWQFSIADNGTGLSPQNLARLFQVFRRFHPASQYPGIGVGLAISRKIVRLHGGQIWMESVDGLGSTVHFTLPRTAALTLPE